MGNNSKISIRASIATKVLLVVLTLYLLIATCVSVSHVWVEYNYQKENIIEDLGDIERAFKPGLAVNLWDLDENALQASVDGMLKVPILVGVKISNNEQALVAIGGIVNGHGKKGAVGFHTNLSGLSDEEAAVHETELYTFEMFERQFQISYNLEGKTIPLGRATIYSNSSVIYRSMKSQITMLTINVFTTLLTFALALLWAVNHYLRKPLRILTDATAGISLNNLGSFSVDTKTSGNNEIKVLGEAMTTMVADLYGAISKREVTEAALRESEERFRLTFETNPDPVILTLLEESSIIDVNKAFEDMTGLSRIEVIGHNSADLDLWVQPERRDVFLDMLKNQGMVANFEAEFRTKGQNNRFGLLSAQIVTIAGEPSALIVMRDITKLKKVEEELARHRDQLELLVENRTRELVETQTKLLQRERLAILGRLTATVSHELRNPLGTIQTALFAIEDSLERKTPDNTNRPLELAERSIGRCVNIIDELNSFARVKELNLSEVSVDAWLRGLIEEQTIPEKIHCDLNLSCGVRASFDQEKLRQAVVNLITNSVHALLEEGSGGNLLQISTRALVDEYEIRVSDDGTGMSADTKEKVFEPLYSTKGFGVGLGMVVVKNIVEQHHGEISIESKKGKGTMVCLRIPISPQE